MKLCHVYYVTLRCSSWLTYVELVDLVTFVLHCNVDQGLYHIAMYPKGYDGLQYSFDGFVAT